MPTNYFNNPILCGFYPDPSICRVGEDYYMVTSSFAYFPGLPVFHSRDLIHWQQIGHGISSGSQLDYKNCETSLGLWAPAIRYHEGLFYIVNTFVSEGREARRDNFIITAKNPAGPWSDPVFINGADGIDPSLFFASDGCLWYTGNFIVENPEYEGHHGIYLVELDKQTFQFKNERKVIWDGKNSRSKWIEAPHLYFINDFYYLIVAEGGTFTNHSVMMARSRTIDGSYEICPRNPVITHRHLSPEHEISVVGHGDLVETQNGEWWMVLLGVRPYKGAHFNLGRETFLLPIKWDTDGWLRVNNQNGLINSRECRPDLPVFCPAPEFYSDNFESPALHPRFNTIHTNDGSFYSLSERPGCLRLYVKPEILSEICTPAFIGRRQQHAHFRLQTALDFDPADFHEEAGLALVQDNRFFYQFTVSAEAEGRYISIQQCSNSQMTVLNQIAVPRSGRIYLTISSSDSGYNFYYGFDDQTMLPLYESASLELLSSLTNEGFTGTYLGMYASSNHNPSKNFADYDWIIYEPV